MNGALKSSTYALAAVVISGAALALTSSAALAQKGEPAPQPPIDCSKPANQKKAACKNRNRELSDDELFYAGYWLARKGEFKLALHYLNQAQSTSDPRILTYIGYATRKLGKTDEAMGYYGRALAADANYTVARAYLGEAYLQRGERQKAVEQLAEIATRCGTSCEEYRELDMALAKTRS